jgi:leader peptidase (prepilin peptidase)/N-methyltransferase
MLGASGATVSLFWLTIPVAACVGSFLATVAWRVPRGLSIVSPRSACVSCAAPLGVRDLIPMLSWSVLRGQCRHCSAPIDRLYPLMELSAVVVAIWSGLVFEGWYVFVSCLLGWTLITLSAIDIRHRTLPDLIVIPLIGLGLIIAWLDNPPIFADHLIGASMGFVAFAGIAFLYRVLRNRDGLGLGDAKLLGAGGAWLGWEALPGIVLSAAIIALIFALASGCARRRPIKGGTAIAFGPYLALAVWLTWIFGPLDLIILGNLWS